MDLVKSKVRLHFCLRVLRWTCTLCSCINFTYNQDTGRFQVSPTLDAVWRTIFMLMRIVSGAFFLLQLLSLTLKGCSGCTAYAYLSVFMVGSILGILCSNLKRDDEIVVEINDMLSIFEAIHAITMDSGIYFPAGFLKFFVLSAVAWASNLQRAIRLCSPSVGISLVSFVLLTLIYWSYLSANLVLAGFYLNMNGFLSPCGDWFRVRRTPHKFRQLIVCSWRIHRAKRRVDAFCRVVYLFYYLFLLYVLGTMTEGFVKFRAIGFYSFDVNDEVGTIYLFELIIFPAYEIFTLNLVAETLRRAETQFRERIFMVFIKRTHRMTTTQRKYVDLLLVQNFIDDLSYRPLKFLESHHRMVLVVVFIFVFLVSVTLASG